MSSYEEISVTFPLHHNVVSVQLEMNSGDSMLGILLKTLLREYSREASSSEPITHHLR